MLRLRFLLAALAAAPSAAVYADGFRIETQIYRGEEEAAINSAVTLFDAGVVYDFLDAPPQIAVFRRPVGDRPGRFIILAADQDIQTELTTDRLEEVMVKLQKWASQQKDPYLRFAAEPRFDESFEADKGELILASHVQSYRLKTEPAEHPKAITEYREFLDWYTRLNALMQSGPPPQPRLKVNEALARHAVVPIEVVLTQEGEEEPLRAEHQFTWKLSKQDRMKIEEVRRLMAAYKRVGNEEFLNRTRMVEANN